METIENFLIVISYLEGMIIGALGLFVLTFIIFIVNISKPYRNAIAKYKFNKKIIDATERNQIKTNDTVYIWLKYIYSLIDDYNKKTKPIYKTFKPIYMIRIYCEWLIGFFRFTILGRWIAAFFAIYLVLGTYIQQSHQQRLATFSNTIAQTEVFLHSKYPTQDSISNDKEQRYYYGSAINLKGALEFLHKNGRDLNYLYLPRSQLSKIKLFPKASLEEAVLNGANLSNSYLFKAQLKEAKLIGANLKKADLRDADLRKAKLIGANLEETDLRGAKLNGADFRNAKLRKIKLARARLVNANFSGTKVRRIDIKEANSLRGIIISNTQLEKIDFSGLNLRKANFSKSSLKESNLKNANLKEVNFNETDLRGTDLTGVNLEKADLSGAKLAGAIITGADFTDAINLTIKQILQTCWLRSGTYQVLGKEIVIEGEYGAPPILPEYLDISADSIYPVHFLKSSIGLPYCPY